MTNLLNRIAIIAAIKKVLSPISDTKIIEIDEINAGTNELVSEDGVRVVENF